MKQDFVESRRFKKKGCKWFGWSDAEAQKHWDTALRNPSVPRDKDAMGNVTLATDLFKEKSLTSGARTGTVREVSEQGQHALEDMTDDAAMQRIRSGHNLSAQRSALSSC